MLREKQELWEFPSYVRVFNAAGNSTLCFPIHAALLFASYPRSNKKYLLWWTLNLNSQTFACKQLSFVKLGPSWFFFRTLAVNFVSDLLLLLWPSWLTGFQITSVKLSVPNTWFLCNQMSCSQFPCYNFPIALKSRTARSQSSVCTQTCHSSPLASWQWGIQKCWLDILGMHMKTLYVKFYMILVLLCDWALKLLTHLFDSASIIISGEKIYRLVHYTVMMMIVMLLLLPMMMMLVLLFQSIKGMMADFQNPNNTQYRGAHVYFTEGQSLNII